MRVFVFEWVCGGGLLGFPDASSSSRERPSSTEIPPTLVAEGFAMLHSIVDDLCRIHADELDLEIVTTLDTRLGRELAADLETWPGEAQIKRVNSKDGELFDRLTRECDATLVIAPEFDGYLLDLSERVLKSGGQLLGSGPQAITIAADKLRLGAHLEARGVATPATSAVETQRPTHNPPWVIKPRFGAGCGHTYRVTDETELDDILMTIRQTGGPRELIASEFCPGIDASVSFLLGGQEIRSLAPGLQHVQVDKRGRLTYQGGEVPLSSPVLARRALKIGLRAVESLPGLRGFVGVDLILADDPLSENSSRDRVIEINPRVTSSYPLLKAMEPERNLMREWLSRNLERGAQN